MNKSGSSSYHSILRSSAIVGVSSVIEIFFRIFRTKCMSLLLGPAGVGLFGMFDALAVLASTISSGGIGFMLYFFYIWQVVGTDFYPRLTAEARDYEKEFAPS